MTGNAPKMKIVKSLPPNHHEIVKYLKPTKEAVYCYGDTIYTLAKEVPVDIELHESVHSKRQGNNPEGWWIRYLTDRAFRLEEEVEAYAYQYLFVKKNAPKAEKYALEEIVDALASPMYDIGKNKYQLETLIRHRAKRIDNN